MTDSFFEAVVGQRNRSEFFDPKTTSEDSLNRVVTLSREELVAEAHSAAAKTARDLFLRFGWKPSLEQLTDHQRELTERH